MSSLRTASIRRALGLFALVFLCSACVSSGVKEAETPPVKEAPKAVAPAAVPDKAQQELANGIASYENGNYKLAARQLQTAALGLEARDEQARAHKFLAFMHCVGGRERLCREEFRKALTSDPAFDLTPAEAGHPTWGPVFRKLKVAAGKSSTK